MEAELEAAFRRHQREIFLYLARVTGDSRLAEDLAQETFLRAFKGLLTYRGDASMRTWLFTIARNVLASHHRRARPAEVPLERVDAMTDPDPSARIGIEQTMERLSQQAREAVVLCDLLGFEPSEAATVVGVTANAFRVRLHRARQQFREIHQS